VRLIIAGIIQDEAYFPGAGQTISMIKTSFYIGPVGVAGQKTNCSPGPSSTAPDTIPERFGLVLVEANAAGVPAIAMDLGSCREVIRKGRPVFWLTTSLKQFGPLDEFLKSIVVPAVAVSGNTFRSYHGRGVRTGLLYDF